MNEEIQKHLVGWLEQVEKGAAQVGDLFSQEAPLFARDVVTLGRVESTFWVGIGVGIMAGSIFVFKKLVRFYLGADEPKFIKDAAMFLAWTVLVSGSVISPCFVLFNLHSLFSSWFAPRVYLMEQLAELMRKTGH